MPKYLLIIAHAPSPNTRALAEAAVRGARTLADLGFDTSLSTVTTEENLAELPELPTLARSVGAGSQHLMWSHRKGRAAVAGNGFFPRIDALLTAVMETVEAAEAEGIALDNVESVKHRVNGVPGHLFFSDPRDVRMIRFHFAVPQPVLDDACERLAKR